MRPILPVARIGEKELADLSGKSLLLPEDRAFHPDAEGVEWRIKKLIRMNYSSLIRSIVGTTHRLRERLAAVANQARGIRNRLVGGWRGRFARDFAEPKLWQKGGSDALAAMGG